MSSRPNHGRVAGHRIDLLAACCGVLVLLVAAPALAGHKQPGGGGTLDKPGGIKPGKPAESSKPKSPPARQQGKPAQNNNDSSKDESAARRKTQQQLTDQSKLEVQQLQSKKTQSQQSELANKQREGNVETPPKLAPPGSTSGDAAAQPDGGTPVSAPSSDAGGTQNGQGQSPTVNGQQKSQSNRHGSSHRGAHRRRASHRAHNPTQVQAAAASLAPASIASSASGRPAGDEPKKSPTHHNTRPTIVERVIHEIPLGYRIALGSLIGLALLLSGVSVRERRRSMRTERDMMVDGLTGVGSRRALKRQLEAEWKRAERHNRPLGLLLLDLDDLKEINDAFGHAAGDELLCSASRSISERVRSSDAVARLGGDEFVVLCPETSQSGLQQLADALENDFQTMKAGVSIGYAEREAFDRGPDDLMARADAAMYAKKRAGALQS